MGDRILKVNGTDVTKATHQEAVMELLRPGDQIVLTIQHDPLPESYQVNTAHFRFQRDIAFKQLFSNAYRAVSLQIKYNFMCVQLYITKLHILFLSLDILCLYYNIDYNIYDDLYFFKKYT